MRSLNFSNYFAGKEVMASQTVINDVTNIAWDYIFPVSICVCLSVGEKVLASGSSFGILNPYGRLTVQGGNRANVMAEDSLRINRLSHEIKQNETILRKSLRSLSVAQHGPMHRGKA